MSFKHVAIIPARGGSKGVPKKNLSKLDGKPLIDYTIEQSLKARSIHQTVVSTDDDEIADHCSKFPVSIVRRPEELGTDEATTHSVILHALNQLQMEHDDIFSIVTLQPTSPLRGALHIDEALFCFESAQPKAESLVSYVKVPHIFNPESIMTRTSDGYLSPLRGSWETVMPRQEKPIYWARNGAAIYITRVDCIPRFIWGGNLLGYEMNEFDSVDIDTYEDLKLAQLKIKYLQSRESDQQ